jgi:hypothetical protein
MGTEERDTFRPVAQVGPNPTFRIGGVGPRMPDCGRP